MHNLQHKFLHFSLRGRKLQHALPFGINIRVSFIQTAMFYHRHEAAERRDKAIRLLELAFADLKDAVMIEKLSQSLKNCGVDLNSHAAKHRGEMPLLPCLCF